MDSPHPCYRSCMAQGEIEIIRGIQASLRGPIGEAIIGFCARWMVFMFALLVAATSFNKRKRSLRHAAYEAAWAGLLALVIATILSTLIGRVRPFIASTDIHLLIPPPASTFAFPSGHTSVSFAIAAALAYGDVSLGGVAFFIAFAVAFGRIASGVHYPTDILGGIVVGFLSFAIVRALHQQLRKRDLRLRVRKPKEKKGGTPA